MDILHFATPALLAMALAYVLTPVAARLAVVIGAIDEPGVRKVHTAAVPRLGGLAVMAAVVVVALLWWQFAAYIWSFPRGLSLGLMCGLLPVVAVSLRDDILPVPASVKLTAHLLGAALAVYFGIRLGSDIHLFGHAVHLGVLAIPLSILWIVGVTNAFNIIDGLDGLSAGLALISAASMAAVFVTVGQVEMAAAVLVIAGALAGFLPYNIHPARLFLGDTGSASIGFCLAAFALKGGSTFSAGFAALIPVLIMGLPIADTFIAMARRTLGRLETHKGGVFVPDCNHIHHRLLALGIGHSKAVFILYGAGLLLASAGLLSIFLQAREAALVVAALLLASFVGIQRLNYDEFALLRRGTMLRVYETPVLKRSMFVVFSDIAIVSLSVYLAVGLKTDDWGLLSHRAAAVTMIALLAPLTIVFCWRFGLYRRSWKLAGLDDFVRIGIAITAAAASAAVVLTYWSPVLHQFSFLVICTLVCLFLVTGARVSYRILLNTQQRAGHSGVPVLLYGAGARGAAAARELFDNAEAGLKPVGFLDDDPEKLRKQVNGVPVLGRGSDLESVLRSTGAKALLAATPHLLPTALERASATCERLQVPLFKVQFKVEQFGAAAAAVLATAAAPEPSVQPTQSWAGPLSTGEVLDVTAPGVQPCPDCHAWRLHRSRSRNTLERLRKKLTNRRLFRCDACGWRGWRLPLDFGLHESPPTSSLPTDLSSLDELIGAGTLEPT